ncbi:hypothetical protein FB45DRAFT_1059718 [Roridomyces roridus]|uniref:Uncharacterized protein n=1 Tax=Roridomyces roridus TaxID=1738132 RepID=A0AAD7FNN8_9AGAR|nr:hypothetical protein FB45DRAFT_1059718 [Roridomyces roridus]
MSSSCATSTTSRELASQLAGTIGLTRSGFRVICRKQHPALIDETSSLANSHRRMWHGVLNDFCRRFLPSLIDAYLSYPSPAGVYARLLTAVISNSYFSDFMRFGLAADLPQLYATHLVENNTWDRQNPDAFRASLETLKRFLYYSRKHPRVHPLSPFLAALLAKLLSRQGARSIEACKIKILRAQQPWRAYDSRMEHVINCHRDNAQMCFALRKFILNPQASAFQFLVDTAYLGRTYVGSAFCAAGKLVVLNPHTLNPLLEPVKLKAQVSFDLRNAVESTCRDHSRTLRGVNLISCGGYRSRSLPNRREGLMSIPEGSG